MKKVFLTGSTGFVGSFVLRELLCEGYEVATLIRPTSDVSRINGELCSVNIINGDFNNLEAIYHNLKTFAPEVVVHLAWQGVKAADRNSSCQIENINASVGIFKLTQKLGCTMFLGMGSQAEYGPVSGRLGEDSPVRPTTLYGASKLSTCLLLDRLANQSNIRFAWLRLFSSYGPGDDPSWMIQYVARTLLQGGRPALTAAQQLWDYIHVKDVAKAVVATIDNQSSGIFNLGSGQTRKLENIIELIRDYIDPNLSLGFGEVQYRPDQVMHLEANITRLQLATNWCPTIPLELGLREVVDWLKMFGCRNQ